VLKKYLHDHREVRAMFVASDEQAFIDFLKKSAIGISTHSRDDSYRSRDDQPVHTENVEVDGYARGEDALVNALLLSRCTTLIRTTSFLSAWASIFNPTLKIILLNKPYDKTLWYPESEILRKHDTEYLPELAPPGSSNGAKISTA